MSHVMLLKYVVGTFKNNLCPEVTLAYNSEYKRCYWTKLYENIWYLPITPGENKLNLK